MLQFQSKRVDISDATILQIKYEMKIKEIKKSVLVFALFFSRDSTGFAVVWMV